MISSEPNLIKLFWLVGSVWPLNRTGATPWYSDKIFAGLIDGLQMSSVSNIHREMAVIGPFWEYPLPANCSNRIPNAYEIRRCSDRRTGLRTIIVSKCCDLGSTLFVVGGGHTKWIECPDRFCGYLVKIFWIKT